MMSTVSMQVSRNDLGQFKAYLDGEEGARIRELSSVVQYGYDIDPQVYWAKEDGVIKKVNPSNIYEELGISGGGMSMGGASMGGMEMSGMPMGGTSDVWEEPLGNEALLEEQYDVIAGKWASAYDEIMIVVDANNELSDTLLYSLGLMDVEVLNDMLKNAEEGNETEKIKTARFTYDDLLGLRYNLVLQSDYYAYDEAAGRWVDRREDDSFLKSLMAQGTELKVVSILRPGEESSASTISGSVVYTAALTEYIAKRNEASDITKAQRENPEMNVLTGQPFDLEDYAGGLPMEDADALMDEMSEEELAQMRQMMGDAGDMTAMLESVAQTGADDASYAANMAAFGVIDYDASNTISIYPLDFEAKKQITAQIEEYNAAQTSAGHDEYVISYTDIMGMMISSVTSIINIISYVLIAFVSISLVVSSLMIGIITYISVLERTKEIGILRSIGASKRDISRVFNAETIIVGLVAGMLGVGITLLLNLPINMIIKSLAGVSSIAALPLYGTVRLIAISVFLTLVAGLIPSRIAAKKDPVEALRTE